MVGLPLEVGWGQWGCWGPESVGLEVEVEVAGSFGLPSAFGHDVGEGLVGKGHVDCMAMFEAVPGDVGTGW